LSAFSLRNSQGCGTRSSTATLKYPRSVFPGIQYFPGYFDFHGTAIEPLGGLLSPDEV